LAQGNFRSPPQLPPLSQPLVHASLITWRQCSASCGARLRPQRSTLGPWPQGLRGCSAAPRPLPRRGRPRCSAALRPSQRPGRPRYSAAPQPWPRPALPVLPPPSAVPSARPCWHGAAHASTPRRALKLRGRTVPSRQARTPGPVAAPRCRCCWGARHRQRHPCMRCLAACPAASSRRRCRRSPWPQQRRQRVWPGSVTLLRGGHASGDRSPGMRPGGLHGGHRDAVRLGIHGCAA